MQLIAQLFFLSLIKWTPQPKRNACVNFDIVNATHSKPGRSDLIIFPSVRTYITVARHNYILRHCSHINLSLQ